MSPHPLDDPILTLAYAREHLDKLETVTCTYRGLKPDLVAREFDAQNHCHIIRFQIPPLTWRVGLTIGDVVNNLRSSLDHLAWRLARLTTPTPSRTTAFPVCERNNREARKKLTRTLCEMPPLAQEIIETLQPYHRGDRAKHEPLWILEELWSITKHRHISVVGMQVDTQLRLPGGVTATFDILNQREIVVTVPADAQMDEDLEPQLSCDVTLGMQEPGLGRSLLVFRDIHDFIRDDVFPKFTGFFPERVG